MMLFAITPVRARCTPLFEPFDVVMAAMLPSPSMIETWVVPRLRR
jgi:hypothetical protein